MKVDEVKDESEMNPPETNHPYETSDLNLASFLRCRNLPILDIRRQNGKTTFAFEESSELRRAILDYANDGLVGVRSFYNTVRDMKGITR